MARHEAQIIAGGLRLLEREARHPSGAGARRHRPGGHPAGARRHREAELKGEGLTALWREEDQNKIETLAVTLTHEQVGAVMGLTGVAADGATVDLEMLLLPLAHAGHARIRALGVLAPLSLPFWLGSKPVTELRLTALRHIGPGPEAFASGPALAPAQTPATTLPTDRPALALHDGGRMRRGLVVYSGGREDLPDPDTN